MEGFMEYTIKMDSDGMIYVPTLMMISLGILVIVRLLPEQFERLQCCHYGWERFTKYTVEVGSGAMIYITEFQNFRGGDTHIGTQETN
jgi:hypothetical protein